MSRATFCVCNSNVCPICHRLQRLSYLSPFATFVLSVTVCNVCPICHRLQRLSYLSPFATFILSVTVCEIITRTWTFQYTRFEYLTLKMKVKDGDDLDENLKANWRCQRVFMYRNYASMFIGLFPMPFRARHIYTIPHSVGLTLFNSVRTVHTICCIFLRSRPWQYFGYTSLDRLIYDVLVRWLGGRVGRCSISTYVFCQPDAGQLWTLLR